MKLRTKQLLSGVLASGLLLSVTALAGARETSNQSAEAASIMAELNGNFASTNSEEILYKTLSNNSAYFEFYNKYGVEKAADVFYNGAQIQFNYAFPLIEKGTTFVPIYEFAEVIGAETTYDAENHAVGLQYKGNEINFKIGEASFSVNGGADQELPVATFVAKERTMVPVRFITEAFGLGLYWNGSKAQVIAADVDSLKEGISNEYTLMDGFFTMTNGQSAGRSIKLAGDMVYTVDKDGKSVIMNSDLAAQANGDLSGMRYDFDCAVDLTEYQEDISAFLQSMSGYPEDAEVLQTLVSSLEKFNMNYVYDLENMVFYVKSDLIGKILPVFVVAEGFTLEVDPEMWYKIDLTDFMLDAEVGTLQAVMAQFAGDGVSSMEDLVDMILQLSTTYDNKTADFYGFAETLMAKTKDSKFTQSGEVYSLDESYDDGTTRVVVALDLLAVDDVISGYVTDLSYTAPNSQPIRVYMAQESSEILDVVVEMTMNDMNLRGEGSFDMSYSTQNAATTPEGNITDLMNIFG